MLKAKATILFYNQLQPTVLLYLQHFYFKTVKIYILISKDPNNHGMLNNTGNQNMITLILSSSKS